MTKMDVNPQNKMISEKYSIDKCQDLTLLYSLHLTKLLQSCRGHGIAITFMA